MIVLEGNLVKYNFGSQQWDRILGLQAV